MQSLWKDKPLDKCWDKFEKPAWTNVMITFGESSLGCTTENSHSIRETLSVAL